MSSEQPDTVNVNDTHAENEMGSTTLIDCSTHYATCTQTYTVLRETALLPYQGTSGKLKAAASLLIPFGTVIVFLGICIGGTHGYALDSTIEMSTLLRITLILHGAYFIALPFNFELMLDNQPGIPEKYKFGEIPARPDNLFWMMTCLCGELFFVTAVAYFLTASQEFVPRWTLFIPIAQSAYNMKNDLVWVLLGNSLSPIKQRVTIMTLDAVFVGICFIIYIVTFFTQ